MKWKSWIHFNLSHCTSPSSCFTIKPTPIEITIHPLNNNIFSFKECFQYFKIVWKLTFNSLYEVGWIFKHWVIDHFKVARIIIIGNIDSKGSLQTKKIWDLPHEARAQWHHLLVVGLMTLIWVWVYLVGGSFVFNTPTRASLGRLLSRVFHMSKLCGNSLETFSQKFFSLKWFFSQMILKANWLSIQMRYVGGVYDIRKSATALLVETHAQIP